MIISSLFIKLFHQGELIIQRPRQSYPFQDNAVLPNGLKNRLTYGRVGVRGERVRGKREGGGGIKGRRKREREKEIDRHAKCK